MSSQPYQLYLSPLRYPGGKRKISNFVKLLFLHNRLVGRDYVEIYAGGAAVALSLLFDEFVSRIHINDVDRAIYSFWLGVLDHTEPLCRRIKDTKVDIDEWDRQRAVQTAEEPDPLDLAFSTFFLNRTNRSGIISGGVIGGKSQKGSWALNARFNKDDLIGRIKKIARFRNRITLTCSDASTYLDCAVPKLSTETFLFLDPPYYVKGGDLYQNSYLHADHEKIAGEVRRLANPWLVSYDSVPEIEDIYRGFHKLDYTLNYSASGRHFGREVMFISRNLCFPVSEAPAARISRRAVEQTRATMLL